MADDEVIVIANPLRKRASASKKPRYTIDITSEPILCNLNPRDVGKALSAAVADLLRNKALGITAQASPATLKARAVAARAFAAGKSWATKRYSGGRIGPMPPNQSDRAFNDSGRFAKSIVAAAQGDKWVVNVAGNRLNPEQVGSVGRVFQRLVELVPEFGDPAKIAEDSGIQTVIAKSVDALIIKAKATGDELSLARIRTYLSTARAVFDLIKAFAA